jgi:hypothetical protein
MAQKSAGEPRRTLLLARIEEYLQRWARRERLAFPLQMQPRHAWVTVANPLRGASVVTLPLCRALPNLLQERVRGPAERRHTQSRTEPAALLWDSRRPLRVSAPG